jgi:hypothetical protein
MGSGQDLPHGHCPRCGQRDDISFGNCKLEPCGLKVEISEESLRALRKIKEEFTPALRSLAGK